MRSLRLPCGEPVPALGQGTWFMGDDPDRRDAEIEALRTGLDLGLGLIDTAEMYGDGRAERLVGAAMAGRRDEAFLVSKVLPSHAGFDATIAACESSLRRLSTDRIDLYLLHWPGGVPFAETVAAFERLQADGKIRHYGVSNLDRGACNRFMRAGGEAMQVNQLLYNLDQRGIEWELLGWLQEAQIVTMAYSPFDGGRLTAHTGLQSLAAQREATAGQMALAWLLQRRLVLPIPKSSHAARVTENAAAADMVLSDAELAALDALFAPPEGPESLAIY